MNYHAVDLFPDWPWTLNQNSHGPGKTGKGPEFVHFVPGREIARNFGLESWKLNCDREIDFMSFVSQIKFLWLKHKR